MARGESLLMQPTPGRRGVGRGRPQLGGGAAGGDIGASALASGRQLGDARSAADFEKAWRASKRDPAAAFA